MYGLVQWEVTMAERLSEAGLRQLGIHLGSSQKEPPIKPDPYVPGK